MGLLSNEFVIKYVIPLNDKNIEFNVSNSKFNPMALRRYRYVLRR